MRLLPLAVLLTACSLALAAAPAREPLKVVATIPDLADITRVIGGDRVEVTTICKGRENTHFVTAKPSHLVALSRADVLVQIGLSLETAFVPGLLENARNPRIQPGQPGFVNTSEGWSALGVPKVVDRKNGDVHPQGNPHMNLDPRGGRQMAERVYAGLCAVEPASKAAFEQRYKTYLGELDVAEQRWKETGAAWKGRKVVVYHAEFDYLAAAYGLTLVGAVEPQPGIPPTPGHIAELVDALRGTPDALILTAVWSNNKQVAELARQTGAKVVELPNLCGGLPGTATWIAMMDLVHARLQTAFGTAPATPPKAARPGE
jgi:zinc/manganese transport system substrate-binding protein